MYSFLNPGSEIHNSTVLLLERHNANFVRFLKQRQSVSHRDNKAPAPRGGWFLCFHCVCSAGVWAVPLLDCRRGCAGKHCHSSSSGKIHKHEQSPRPGSVNEQAKPLGCGHVTPSVKTPNRPWLSFRVYIWKARYDSFLVCPGLWAQVRLLQSQNGGVIRISFPRGLGRRIAMFLSDIEVANAVLKLQ